MREKVAYQFWNTWSFSCWDQWASHKMVGKDAYHIKICLYPFHVLLANKILLCSGSNFPIWEIKPYDILIWASYRYNWCSYGIYLFAVLYCKPIGVAAHVDIRQVLINIWAKYANKVHVIEWNRGENSNFLEDKRLSEITNGVSLNTLVLNMWHYKRI